MMQVLSIASAHYAQGVHEFVIPIPAGCRGLLVSLTREDWPVGPAMAVELRTPEDEPMVGYTFNGGISPKKGGGILTANSFGMKAQADQDDIPAGDYPFRVEVLSADGLDTAITAEATTV